MTTILSTTIKPTTKVLDKYMMPSIRARLKEAFNVVRTLNPNISGYVGHDGQRMFFQVFGDRTFYSLTMDFVNNTPSNDPHFS